MKKGAIFGMAALLAAGAAAAVLLGRKDRTGAPAPEESGTPDASAAPVHADQTAAFPLKNKYADYTMGPDRPRYLFELETPDGAKEIAVSAEQYETYYIGDEIVCLETGKGWQIV